MAHLGENTLHELENILNGSETDTDRWAAFLKHKTATRPQKNPQFLLGGCDISFDVDVDLIKLPAKQTDTVSTAQELLEQKETLNNLTTRNGQNLVMESQPQSQVNGLYELDNVPPARRSLRISSVRSDRLSSSTSPLVSGNMPLVPQRLQDINVTFDASVRDFLPAVSSTPSTVKWAGQLANEQGARKASIASAAVTEKVTGAAAVAGTEGLAKPAVTAAVVESSEVTVSTGVAQTNGAAELAGVVESLAIGESGGTAVAAELVAEAATAEAATAESAISTGVKSEVPVSIEAAQNLLANDDFESSYLANLMNMQSKGNMPFALPNRKTSQQFPKSLSKANKTMCRNTNEENTKSHQSVKPLKVHLKHVILQTIDNPPAEQLSSGNDSMPSQTPHNLAAVAGDATHPNAIQTTETSIQLLDLHCSHSNGPSNNGAKNDVKTVLNKPARPAINGEEFAQELARMSHCEILDLRKRNSIGLFAVRDGQTTISKEEQLDVEQHIKSELLRRQTGDTIEKLAKLQSLKSVIDQSTESVLSSKIMQPPKIQDTELLPRERPRRGRPRRREKQMTEELKNYLKLSDTVELRLRSRSSNMSKRSLYTKGDSDVENSLLKSPVKTSHHCYRGIEIAPAPPKESVTSEEISIVPPPPASIRYSQNICNSRRWERNRSEDLEELAVLEKEVVQKEVNENREQQHENVKAKEMHGEYLRQKKAQKLKEIQEKVQLQEEQQEREIQQQFEQSMSRLQQKQERQEIMQQEKEELLQQSQLHLKVPQKEMQAEMDPQEEFLIVGNSEVEVQQETEPFQPPADEVSMHMEALRMSTPTPPLPTTSDHEQSRLSEGPSTSKAARKALELFQRQEAKKQKKILVKNLQKADKAKDTVPNPPESAKSSGKSSTRSKTLLQNTLSKLQINLANVTLAPFEEDQTLETDTTVRRSRRGQMPLRNTWCHTLSDPFAFMRDLLTGEKKSMKRKREHEGTNSGNKMQLMENKHQHTELRPRTKKRVRIRDPETVDTAPAPELEPEPEPKPEALAPQMIESQAVPEMEPESLDAQPKEQNGHLISFLRAISNNRPDTIEQASDKYDSMIISSASDLSFSNLGGIEYAFYSTEDVCTVGYMRFQAMQQRGMTQNKTNSLRFIVLTGQFKVESGFQNTSSIEHFVLEAGDMVEIRQGSRFNITNLANEVGILIVNRKSQNANNK